MCTMIVEKVNIDGSGKGTAGWFALRQANVSYDHPFNAPLEHALNIDFVDEAQGPGARVAVELSAEAARSGSHIATMPVKVFDALFKHPLTDKGVELFLEDWKKVEASTKQAEGN